MRIKDSKIIATTDENIKTIILDYRNGRVVVVDGEVDVDEWADANGTSADDCCWMSWSGEVE